VEVLPDALGWITWVAGPDALVQNSDPLHGSCGTGRAVAPVLEVERIGRFGLAVAIEGEGVGTRDGSALAASKGVGLRKRAAGKVLVYILRHYSVEFLERLRYAHGGVAWVAIELALVKFEGTNCQCSVATGAASTISIEGCSLHCCVVFDVGTRWT
jgi:hypothetical protein